MNWNSYLINGLKGYAMGAANVVPGVSGGTIALLTGIYTELIDAINTFMDIQTWKLFFSGKFKEFWKYIHGGFLLSLAFGVALSIFSLANLMKYVIVYYPVQTWAFFFGLIIASAVYIFLDIKKWQVKDVLFALVGGALGVGVCLLSPTNTPDDLWFIFVSGAIAVCTMILPGISGSFVLLILGKYDYIMTAISEMNIPVLVVFAIGCAVGILAFSKFLHWLLARAERQTMLVLLGFVLGSLIKVWPWNDMTAVTKAHFLHNGMDVATADSAVSALIETGADLASVAEMHVYSAMVWAILGLLLVVALQRLSVKK